MAQEGEQQARVRPTYLKDERQLLEAWLDFQRATLAAKCTGLSEAERKARPIATSLLSLHGLVRHMAEVERNWFQRIFLGDASRLRIWPEAEEGGTEGGAIFPLDQASWDEDLAVWEAECEASRQAAGGRELEECGTWRDKTVSLRSIYLHMIQEYARHNGHADFLRELADGAVGL